MPPKSKKQSANPHDKRHENGLAAPGIRISREQSYSNLYGHATEKPSSPSPSASEAIHNLSPRAPPTQSGSPGAANGILAATHINMAVRTVADGTEELSRENAVGEAGDNVMENASFEPSPHVLQKAETNINTIDLIYSVNMSEPATTVIEPSPVRDVVAILLLLLQLPPTMLTFIHCGFTVLTLSPPTTGWFPASLFSIPDWFHSYSGNPSLLTMVLVDMAVLVLWLFFPKGWKDFILDVAQVVVAISLGGGTSRRGWTHSLISLGIVVFIHLIRNKDIIQQPITFLWSLMSRIDWGPFKGSMSVPFSSSATYPAHGYIRTFLELHIVAQGIVKVVRRALSRRPELTSGPGKKSDTESGTTSVVVWTPMLNDTTADGARNSSSDGRTPGLPPVNRDVKDKSISSGKRRRKQAAFVRSQQPFWAAIASTKITISEKIEQSQALNDAKEANAKDATQLGNANDHASADRVWITKVDDMEIWFCATLAKDVKEKNIIDGPSSDDQSEEALRVRVNSADWSSISCQGDWTDEKKHSLVGKIFGLMASTNYIIEFVRASDLKTLYAASLLTRSLATSYQGKLSDFRNPALNRSTDFPGTTTLQQPQDSLRPSSPCTTLKNSITATHFKLNEKRSNTRKARKDYRTAESAIEKDVDSFKSRLASRGGTDERQKQRKIQYSQNIRQAEEAAALIISQTVELGEIPEHMHENFAASKLKWREGLNRRDAMRDELDKMKLEGEYEETAARSEHAAVKQKREKLQARLNRINQQYDDLVSANAQTLKAKVKQNKDRALLVASWQRQEQEFQGKTQGFEAQTRELGAKTARLDSQVYYLEIGQNPYLHGRHSIPPTPEALYSTLAASRVSPGLQSYSMYSNFQQPIGTPPARHSSLRKQTKGRSSSMLSEVSGFTDDETAVPSPSPAPLSTPFSASGTGINDGRNGIVADGKRKSDGGSPHNPVTPGPKLSPIGTGRGSPWNKA